MTPKFRLGMTAGWGRVVAVFMVDAALLGAGVTAAGRPGWWVGAVLGSILSVAALVSWRGSALLTLAWRAAGSGRTAVAPAGAVADHDRMFGAGPVGIRAAGPHLVTVVAVDGHPHSPSVLDHHRVESLTTLPIDAVATGLRQFDVTLDGIDVISVGARRSPKTHHDYAPVYSARVGDHPAVGQRQTWLIVRLDATTSARAILWRESVAATMSAATEWLAQELTSRRIPARVLTATQIHAVDEALLAGTNPATLRRGWDRLRHPNGYIHTYWVSPQDISSATIDRLWTPDTEATVVTLQLRLTPTGATTIGVLARYHSGGPLVEPPLTGLNPMTGQHDSGMTAGLLTATAVPALPARALVDGEQLAVPIGATGIIIGTTPTGHPLLIDLGDPTGTATMTIAGEHALTMQIALRATATGYHVLVHTNRPQHWKQATGAGLQIVSAAGLTQQLPPSPRRWMVIFDQLDGPTHDGAAVTIRTVNPGAASGADIHIEQDDPDSAVIRTWAFQYRLRIELDYERHLIDAGLAQAV
ncbi:MAG: type VII secretion protein EccE [Mycobacteriaceae bacterium]|nr:type VII secretion protein EccE [Mycobacteriaceae bacterium]